MHDDSDSDGDLFSPTRRKTVNGIDESASPKGEAPYSRGSALKALSPRGKPGSTKDRKDSGGRTIVEVISYEKFDANREYSGMVEKSAKYSGKWVPRHILLKDIDLQYSMVDGQPPKDTIRMTKVTRGAELGRDRFSIVVEGKGKENKPVEFMFKAKDAEETELWWLRCSHALSGGGQANEMPREGMPLAHPRTGLPFTNIPLEHLATFAPLDRLVLHFFAPAMHKQRFETSAFVFVGDLCVYLCDPKADIKRCIAVRSITSILTVGGSTGTWTVGLQCSVPEYDLLFTMAHDLAEKFVSVVTALHAHFGAPKGSSEPPVLKRQKLAKESLLIPQLAMDPSDFYELKIRLPMSKRFLMKMVVDGEQSGALTVKKVVKHLGIQMAADPAAATAAGGKPGDKPTDAAAKDGKKSDPINANPLGELEKRKEDASKPPGPPGGSDSDSDGRSGGRRATKPPGGDDPSKPPPPPKFADDDSDGESGLPKSSPLAGAFGGAGTQSRTEKGPGGSLTGPSPPVAFAGGVQLAMGVDRMHRLLNTIGLPQYYAVLTERGVDWEIFACMDTLDLKKFGVSSVDHQVKIENALNNVDLMNALRKQPDGGGGPAMTSSGGGMPPPPPPPSGGTTNGGFAPPPPPPSKPPVFIDDDDL